LLSTKPDIVHVKTSSGINFYQNALYVLFARIFGKRVLLQVHSGGFPAFYDSASRIERTAIRAALRLPHRLLALSDNWAQYFRMIVGADHVVVVCNALPTKEYLLATPDRLRFRIPPKRITLLFIGTRSRSLDIAKGIRELIQAVALVRERHPELTLIMAGKISHETELRSVLGPSGDGWIATGVVTTDVKPTLYRSVDLFALPSHYENMPNTLLEAMAAGLPVVATTVGAIPEVVQDQENGFLVQVGDVTTLAERIERLVSDERLRESMGQIARNTVVEKFDFSVLERQLSCEYNVSIN
jgi:glycosyltransferase involved in cell wall biosynthesis